MTLILLVLLGVIAIAAISASFALVAHDGYRAAPTRPELLRHP